MPQGPFALGQDGQAPSQKRGWWLEMVLLDCFTYTERLS